MKKEFSIVIEQDEEGVFVASVPELGLPYTGKIFGRFDEANS